mgnify:CR=1 FL=1
MSNKKVFVPVLCIDKMPPENKKVFIQTTRFGSGQGIVLNHFVHTKATVIFTFKGITHENVIYKSEIIWLEEKLIPSEVVETPVTY